MKQLSPLSAFVLASLVTVGCGGKVTFETSGAGGDGGSGGSHSTSVKTVSVGATTGTTNVGVTGSVVDGSSSVDVGSNVSVASSSSGGGCLAQCEMAQPQGFAVFEHRVVRSCGCHQPFQSPCHDACIMTPACQPNGPPPDGACATCIDALTKNDQCVVDAALSPPCQMNPDCIAFVNCAVSCP